MQTKNTHFTLVFAQIKNTMPLIVKAWILSLSVLSLAVGAEALSETGPITIERIACEGTHRTSCDYIKDQLLVKEGEILNDDRLRDSMTRLSVLGLFEEVTPQLSKGSQLGRAILTVKVSEQSSYSLNPTLEFVNPTQYLYGYLDLVGADRNFTGAGDVLSLRVQSREIFATATQGQTLRDFSFKGRVEYSRTNLFTPRLFAIAGIAGEKAYSTHGPYGSGWGDLALGYKIFDYSSVALGYRFNSKRYSGDKSNGFLIRYGWDSTDDPNFPTQGSRFQLDIERETAHFGNSSYPQWTIDAHFNKHWELAPGHVMSFVGGRFNSDPAFTLPGDEAFGFRYTRQFRRHANGKTVTNGAAYIQPALFSFTDSAISGYSDTQGLGLRPLSSPGLKLGTTLQTSWGVINLSFLYFGGWRL